MRFVSYAIFPRNLHDYEEYHKGKRQGLQWTLNSILQDLDYADDLGILSSINQNIKQKTELLSVTAKKMD